MREIVLDTETTGLDPQSGDRIVEIGAVELANGLPTGRTWHRYVNPQRPMPAAAFAVHGLGDDFLRDKPVFAAILEGFLDFIADAPLVIHNAAFDIGFLDAELARCGAPPLGSARAIDTLDMARGRFPGANNSLDALCRRFGVDNSGRDLHGALLDAQLLAEVYLELSGGRQRGFELLATAPSQDARDGGSQSRSAGSVARRPRPLAPRLTEKERAAHATLVAELGDKTLWPRRDD
jgi:DNA polymerase-3 subunit epsilon